MNNENRDAGKSKKEILGESFENLLKDKSVKEENSECEFLINVADSKLLQQNCKIPVCQNPTPKVSVKLRSPVTLRRPQRYMPSLWTQKPIDCPIL